MKNFLQKIFSVKEGNNHLIVTILGLKLKFRNNSIKYSKKMGKVYVPYVETHLADHCNLNCRGCTHFCPVTPEKLKNIEDFKKELIELEKKCDLSAVRLMGGEPLLHPNVCDFIKVTREIFPNSNVLILTNGILLKTMSEEFWNTLRENDITIEMTHYPIIKDFDSYIDLIKSHNVRLGGIHEVDKFMLIVNPNGDSNVKKTYKDCPSKNCVNLRDGKLFVCPTGCYMDNYNNYFKTKIAEEAGIEIASSSSQEIYNYLSKPIETCKYCLGAHEAKLVEWGVSSKEAQEWYGI